MPGTFGSLLGLAWFVLLIAPRNVWLFGLGACVAAGASVWFCGAAEKILRQTDPGSVVLDEIVAMPLCFVAWMGVYFRDHQQAPGLDHFFADGHWVWTVGIFAAFRLFDIAKPWPVRQSQTLPGGWGVTIDDLLAAAYVNFCTLAVWAVKGWVS